MAVALAASAAVEKEKPAEAKPAAAEDKKQDKRGLYDFGYGWDSPTIIEAHDPWAYPKTVTIEKNVPVPYPVEVEKHIPVVVEKKVPVVVEKHIPVDRPVPYAVRVPVKVPVIHKVAVEVPRPYPVAVPKPYPVHVDRPVFIEKHSPLILKSGWDLPVHSYSSIHTFH